LNELRKNTVASLSRYEDLLPPEEMLADLTGVPEEEETVQDHLEQLYPLPGSGQDAQNQSKKAEAIMAQVKNVVETEANNAASSTQPTDKNYKDLRGFAEDPDPCKALKQHGIINDDPFGLRSKPAS
jgi:hypothetical protein